MVGKFPYNFTNLFPGALPLGWLVASTRVRELAMLPVRSVCGWLGGLRVGPGGR